MTGGEARGAASLPLRGHDASGRTVTLGYRAPNLLRAVVLRGLDARERELALPINGDAVQSDQAPRAIEVGKSASEVVPGYAVVS